MEPIAFEQRSAIIFGGANGIGLAVAREFAKRGAKVLVADIDAGAAEDAAALIRKDGGTAAAIGCDVLSSEGLDLALAEGARIFGPPDIVMNNVGVILNGHPEDIPEEEWQRIGDLSYGAAWRCIKRVLPEMLARGSGHIVNTASFAGMYPYASTRMPYAAAKASVISLSQNLALYCEPRGVRVTCLIPGPVRTGIAASMRNWTPDAPMQKPGAELEMMEPAVVASRLADAMCDGRILVASDDALWDIVRRWAADPDAFLRERIRNARERDADLQGT